MFPPGELSRRPGGHGPSGSGTPPGTVGGWPPSSPTSRRSATRVTFRRLWAGQTISAMGSQLTLVALAYQTFHLTHSTFMVGLLGFVGLAPLLAGSLWGGTLADAWDRRRVLTLTQFAMALAVGGLAATPRWTTPRCGSSSSAPRPAPGSRAWTGRPAAPRAHAGLLRRRDRRGHPPDHHHGAVDGGGPRSRRRAHRPHRAHHGLPDRRRHLCGVPHRGPVPPPPGAVRGRDTDGTPLDDRGVPPPPGRAPAVRHLPHRPQRHDLRHAPGGVPGPGRPPVRRWGGRRRPALRRTGRRGAGRVAGHRVDRPDPAPGPSHRRLRGGLGLAPSPSSGWCRSSGSAWSCSVWPVPRT